VIRLIIRPLPVRRCRTLWKDTATQAAQNSPSR
jgi:hypothetical protein